MRVIFGLLSQLGKIVLFFGVLMMLPAGVSVWHDDGFAMVYLIHAGGAIGGGFLLFLSGFQFRRRIGLRDGFLLVTLIWTVLPAIAALPIQAILPDLSFTHAYFEAASGLTATGATVLSGIDDLPPSLNFWRGEMIWLGGMGLIVLVVAVLPVLSAGSAAMMQTELPGPAKDERLTPQIAQTAKSLWLTYTALTAACAMSYWAAGMSLLDAIIHAFTTLGLGGFSSHDASYGYFDSPMIEAVAILFMTLAGMNFILHFLALKRRTLHLYWNNLECRAYLLILVLATAAVVFYLRASDTYLTWADAARYGIFNAVSIMTTTGYSNADYNAWPLFAPLLMLFLANILSCSGSTGGGIKMQRTVLAFYQAESESQKNLHPHAYYVNKAAPTMPGKHLISTLFFILAYISTAAVLMLALSATGMDFITSFSAAAATISNTGPGLGEVGPTSNYGWMTTTQTWLCAFAMLIGRLELLSFLMLLRRSFWRY